MKNLNDFKRSGAKIRYLFCDIDDTLTTNGQLPAASYAALWNLHNKSVHVIPVTGRPAGWCEMIARFWPVSGIIGENGGFYFRYDCKNRKMIRKFFADAKTQGQNREHLKRIETDILKQVPNCRVASDQFSRLMDLAIDFAEDVGPLSQKEVDTIVEIFKRHGAKAKVSSIHVNGWFGEYDKLTMCQTFMRDVFSVDMQASQRELAFVGDSPNDEPMFRFFDNSFGVANVRHFEAQIQFPPKFVATREGGEGFVEIANTLLA